MVRIFHHCDLYFTFWRETKQLYLLSILIERMAQFLRKCGWFLVLLVALNVLYLALLLCFSPGFKKVYDIAFLKNQKYDLLVLGNSMALDGIDAAYLTKHGINSYNFAVAGDHVSTSLLLLETYLQNNPKPKTVLIGLSSSIGNSYLNKVPFTNPEVEFFYHPSLVSNITKPPLFNFQWLFVDFLKVIISKDHRKAQLIQGQWKTKKMIPDGSHFNQSNVTKLAYNDPYLAKITALCDANGIQVILTELPGSASNRNALPFTYTATLATGKTSVIYNLNSNDTASKILDPSKDWLAADHLNEYGAEKITNYLLNNVLRQK